MATILITGSTGTVGQCLVPLLKQRGHRLIHLVRPRPQQSALERLRVILDGYITEEDVWWAGDVRERECGVVPAHLIHWRGKIDHIVHCAASISFDSSVAEETWETNLGGTLHALELANELRIPSFHHISTAYVAGNAPRFTEDDLRVGQTNHNAYEESKLAAEEAVHAWQGGRWTIHRMSIMIGDSRTGWIPTFTGYYGFFLHFWRLLNKLRREWDQNPERLRQSGIWFNDQGTLHLPLVIRCSVASRLNLLPSDWFAWSVAELIGRGGGSQTYHHVHPDPPLVRWVIETSLRHLGISGVSFGELHEEQGGLLLQSLQRMLDRGLERYGPYVTHGPEFTSDHLVEGLGSAYVPPPRIDAAVLGKMLEYAVRVGFGKP